MYFLHAIGSFLGCYHFCSWSYFRLLYLFGWIILTLDKINRSNAHLVSDGMSFPLEVPATLDEPSFFGNSLLVSWCASHLLYDSGSYFSSDMTSEIMPAFLKQFLMISGFVSFHICPSNELKHYLGIFLPWLYLCQFTKALPHVDFNNLKTDKLSGCRRWDELGGSFNIIILLSWDILINLASICDMNIIYW